MLRSSGGATLARTSRADDGCHRCVTTSKRFGCTSRRGGAQERLWDRAVTATVTCGGARNGVSSCNAPCWRASAPSLMELRGPHHLIGARNTIPTRPPPPPSRWKVVAVLIVSVVAAHLSACSVGSLPISQSPSDPSSPSAPEGVDPRSAAPPARSATPPQPGGHSEHAGHAAAPDAGATAPVYTCPMHPEISSSAPGLCPKCNMKLVPKK